MYKYTIKIMPVDKISKRERELPGARLAELLRIAEERKDVISLGPGEPDFVAPAPIRAAIKTALAAGQTHYSPAEGRIELRRAICKKLKRENKIRAKPENIVVTCGSQEALLLALMCIIDPGEEVIVPDPGFLAYRPTVELLNGVAVGLELREDEEWKINTNRLERLIDEKRTRAIILNSPANPTGSVLSAAEMKEIARLAADYDLYIIADEAYEKIIYGNTKHISIGSLKAARDRTITLQSCSKTFAMPGLRVGWACAPKELATAMTEIHIYTTVCAPTPAQTAVAWALQKLSPKYIEKMRREYDRRRKFMWPRLNEIGLSTVEPKGAFFMFSNIRGTGLTSNQFVNRMLKSAKVVTIPGTEFGKFGEGYVRLSYATGLAKIKTALERMEKEIKKMKKE
jgi:aminotransferase